MAKDDYYVIAYRILAYLYVCLKKGVEPGREYLQADTDAFPVEKRYWDYIIRHLTEDEYIEGVMLFSILGQDVKGIKITDGIMITPKGIDFLQNNPAMSRAGEFLKTLKETIPGL